MALSMPAAVWMMRGGGMAGHGLERDALGDEAADPLEGDDLFKFDAVAEGAAGGDDRVDQFDAGQRNSHVGFHAGQSSFGPWVKGQGSVACIFYPLALMASVSTRPTAAEGLLTPASEANVTARSTGATRS